MSKDPQILMWLQKWLQAQCDGEWEKAKGITIETLETPGWMVTIDLEGTALENAAMEEAKRERSAGDWIHCGIRNGKFEGQGDAAKLGAILEHFEKWATRMSGPGDRLK